MRRRLIPALAIGALIPAGAALASTAPVGTDDSGAGSAPATSMPMSESTGTPPASTPGPAADPAAAEVPTLYDDEGQPEATFEAQEMVVGWTEFAEDEGPDDGNQYVGVTLLVTNLRTEDGFTTNVDHFVLQDTQNHLTRGAAVRSAAQAEADEDAVGEQEIENGSSTELAVTFELSTDSVPQAVFFLDDDRLVHVADIGADQMSGTSGSTPTDTMAGSTPMDTAAGSTPMDTAAGSTPMDTMAGSTPVDSTTG